MSTPLFAIVILMIPLFVFMAKWSKVMNQYRDLYQNKISPKVPVSNKAVMEEFQKDPASTYKNIVSGKATVSLIKILFGRVEDPELKQAQSKARRALVYALIYMVMWVIVDGLILYFS